jgi:hypothetical protein
MVTVNRKNPGSKPRRDIMKRASILSIGLLMVLAVATAASAQTQPPQTPQKPAGTAIGPNFVDLNGDGICDNYQTGNRAGRAARVGRGGYGPGDGTGNQHVGPKDGTGYGPGAAGGTGICDGTGPKGKALRRGARK